VTWNRTYVRGVGVMRYRDDIKVAGVAVRGAKIKANFLKVLCFTITTYNTTTVDLKILQRIYALKCHRSS
jgi:hypothetical protein